MREGILHQGILLDTSFLIRLTNENEPLHLTAKAYFDAANKANIPLHLSALVVAEFEVKHPLSTDIRDALIPAPFDYIDGKRAALFQREVGERDPGDSRAILRIDTLLMAQAHRRNLGAILTSDKNTLAKYLARLREKNLTNVHAIVLSDGFELSRLKTPGQLNLQMQLTKS